MESDNYSVSTYTLYVCASTMFEGQHEPMNPVLISLHALDKRKAGSC